MYADANLTKDIRSLFGQAHEVAPNLIITGFGGLPDLGHHGLPLLLELGVNQADTHVLCHLIHWNELAGDGRHHNLAALLPSCPAPQSQLHVQVSIRLAMLPYESWSCLVQ